MKQIDEFGILRSRIYKFIGVCFCSGLLIAVIVDWLSFYGFIDLEIKKYSRALVLGFMIIPLVDPSTLKKGIRFPLSTQFIVMGFMFLVYALYKQNLTSEIYYVTRIIFWIMGGFYVHRMLVNEIFPKKVLTLTINAIVIIYFLMVLLTLLNPSARFSQNISIYTLLWIVPLLMLRETSIKKTIFVIMACLSILLSFKRGAMVALILSTISYLFARFLLKRSLWTVFKSFGLTLILMSTVVMSIYFVSQTRPVFFQKRIADLTGENSVGIGSGRGVFYNVIKDHYLDSFNNDTLKLFFGFGSRSVQELIAEYYNTPVNYGAYAHSDWLQLIHDYGLLGMAVLVLMHISIFRLLYRYYKSENIQFPAFVMTYTIFFLLNIYSGFFFAPTAIYFSIFIAIVDIDSSKLDSVHPETRFFGQGQGIRRL